MSYLNVNFIEQVVKISNEYQTFKRTYYGSGHAGLNKDIQDKIEEVAMEMNQKNNRIQKSTVSTKVLRNSIF